MITITPPHIPLRWLDLVNVISGQLVFFKEGSSLCCLGDSARQLAYRFDLPLTQYRLLEDSDEAKESDLLVAWLEQDDIPIIEESFAGSDYLIIECHVGEIKASPSSSPSFYPA